MFCERLDAVAQGKQLKDALHQSETRFQLLADTVPGWVWVADSNGQCCWCNNSWQELTGRSLASEIGRQWTISVAVEDQQVVKQAYSSSLVNGKKLQQDLRLHDASGGSRWYSVTGMPQHSAAGDLVAYVLCGVEKSQTTVIAIEQQQLATEQIDSFLAQVGFELRQPIANIKIAIHLLNSLQKAPLALSPLLHQQKIAQYLRVLLDECEREISAIKRFTTSPVLVELLRQVLSPTPTTEANSSLALMPTEPSQEVLCGTAIHCPECGSNRNSRNGSKRGKQRYFCADCARSFTT